jgi:hypothetical protein
VLEVDISDVTNKKCLGEMLMKNAIVISCLVVLSGVSTLDAWAAPGFDTAVSEKCGQFFKKASASFVVKNIRTSPSASGYASFEMSFVPPVARAIETNDYSMAFSCKKTSDPTWKFIPLEQLTATLDFNGTTKYREQISDMALGEFGKLISYGASISESEGRKRLAACFSAASKNPSKVSSVTSRFDATYEDGTGAEFSCFRISGARWSSYGLSMSNGFNFTKASLMK